MLGLTAIDLFSGAGGATQGLRDAGYTVIGAIELDATASSTYLANHPCVHLINTDIASATPGSVREQLGLKPGDLTLLNACPPCQGFSTLGKRNRADPRNDLIFSVIPFIKEFQPKAIVIENVPQLVHDQRLTSLIHRIRRCGYGVSSYVVNATDFGVPQSRKRAIIVGIKGRGRKKLPARVPDALPDTFERSDIRAGTWLSIAGSAASNDSLHIARKLSENVLRRIKAIPIGGSRFDLPAELVLACHNGRHHEATSAYGRILADAPAPTMTTRCTSPSCGRFIHPTEHRGLTLREAALLQTFPASYRFCGHYSEIERQIGNALPVKMTMGIALIVKELLT